MAPRSEGSYGNGNGAEVVALYSPFIPIREQLQGCLGFKMIFFSKKGVTYGSKIYSLDFILLFSIDLFVMRWLSVRAVRNICVGVS